MSSNRDPFKKITNIYKSFLTSGSLMSGEDRIKDPFLCMNIVCPPRSYDINIEPAKDGVLFTNTNLVIGEIEQFFQGLYGDLQVKTSGNLQSKVAGPKARGFDLLLARKPSLVSATVSKPGDCDLANFAHKRYGQHGDPPMGANKIGIGLAAESPLSESSNSNLTLNSKQGTHNGVPHSDSVFFGNPTRCDTPDITKQRSMASKPRWLPNMRSDDEDEIDIPNSQLFEWQSQGNPDLDEEELSRDLSNSNPWVFAKTNASVRQYDKSVEKIAGPDSNDQLYTPRRQADDLVGVKARQAKKALQNSDSMLSGLLTPKCNEENHVITTPSPFSDDLFPYPQRAWVNTESRAASKNSRAIDRPIDRAGPLDTWIQTPSRSHSTSPYTVDGLDDNVRYINSDRHRDAPDFVSARNLLVGTPPNTIPDLVTRISRKPTKRSHQAIKSNPNKPFISPLNSSGHVRLLKRPENRGGRLSSTHSLGVSGRTLTAQPQIEGSGVISESEPSSQVSSVHSDLALAMDYELRKQEAFQKWKENQRRNIVAEQQGKGAPEDISRPSFASPHQNRYQKAKAALHSAQPDHNVLPAPALDPSDSRAYLMRVQQREATAAPDESPSRLRKRRKTSRLPLETLREDSLVRDLNLDINTQALDLKSSLGLLGAGICKDEYIATGNINVDAFSPLDLNDMKQIRAWEARLKELVQTLHSSEFEQQYPSSNADMRFDLWSIFQTHQTANP